MEGKQKQWPLSPVLSPLVGAGYPGTKGHQQIHCSSQRLSAHSPLPFSFLHQPQLPALRGQQPSTSQSSS